MHHDTHYTYYFDDFKILFLLDHKFNIILNNTHTS